VLTSADFDKSLLDERTMKRTWLVLSKLYFEALSPKAQQLERGDFHLRKPNSNDFDIRRVLKYYHGGDGAWENVYDVLFFHTIDIKSLGWHRIALLDTEKYAIVPAAATSGDVISILTNSKKDSRFEKVGFMIHMYSVRSSGIAFHPR
jgi:hypothetical protein